MSENWKVATCELKDLEKTMNELETLGYEIQKYDPMPESFHWIVIGRLVQGE
jgi:hypothetical protein